MHVQVSQVFRLEESMLETLPNIAHKLLFRLLLVATYYFSVAYMWKYDEKI